MVAISYSEKSDYKAISITTVHVIAHSIQFANLIKTTNLVYRYFEALEIEIIHLCTQLVGFAILVRIINHEPLIWH